MILRETMESSEDQAWGNTCQFAPLTYLDAAWSQQNSQPSDALDSVTVCWHCADLRS